MNPAVFLRMTAIALLGSRIALAALTPEQVRNLAPPVSRQVDFTREIKPIFEASCIKCHGRGKSKGGFQLDTRETFLKSGDSGPAATGGQSAESYLIELVSSADPDIAMPKKGSKLTREQVGILRAWIDQGMSWDEGVTFGKLPPLNLFPRRPEIPPSETPNDSTHPIDRILQPYFSKHEVAPRALADDRIFARRVFLDAIGLLPSPSELEEFLVDSRPDKRRRLVEQLLGNHARYAEHWLTFWNDALRNDYRGTGYIDGGRKQITEWLYSALATNLPYHQFVARLINPTPESEGFTKGIVWRGVVNSSQTPQMQAAQNISQVFMGVNLKCASCHDSFINDWSLADSYGLAGIYSDHELEMVQCDKPTGRNAALRFIYPEIGAIDPTAAKPERLRQLADIMTQEKNGRLTRTIVNRLWARFMGRGLVEPLDDMEKPSWNPDLLDWLASDLADHGYDLKKTMERILTSEAYQRPAVPSDDEGKEYVFRGPAVRRMSAEQYSDALTAVTGVGYDLPVAKVGLAASLRDFPNSLPATNRIDRPHWIWKDGHAATGTEAGVLYFRKSLELKSRPTKALVVITCDNSFQLFVNGKEVATGKDYAKPALVDIHAHLVSGSNVIAVAAVNAQAAPKNPESDQTSPAGLLVYAMIRYETSRDGTVAERVLDLTSDASWVWSMQIAGDWKGPEFSEHEWRPSVVLGEPGMAPWRVEKAFNDLLATASLQGKVRASLVNADPLLTALGRPNREQVSTTRSSVATTLQALELTNGATLANRLRRGAAKLLEEDFETGRSLVVAVFARALARKPNATELEMAADLVGSPLRQEGVEDLVWAMTMHPEFQLIY